MIEIEKTKRYGHVYEMYTGYHALLARLDSVGCGDSDNELLKIGKDCPVPFTDHGWNARLLLKCVDKKMPDNALALWRQLDVTVSAEELESETHTLVITILERVKTANRQTPARGGAKRKTGRPSQESAKTREVKKEVKTSLVEATKYRDLPLLGKIWRDFIEAEKKKALEESGQAQPEEKATEMAETSTQTEAK